MEYIENDFAQIEHINQIIHNNSKHSSYDCFDVVELVKQFPELGYYDKNNPENSYLIIPENVKNIRLEPVNGHTHLRYNSFIISIERVYGELINGKQEEFFQYTFEVRNALWDGTFVLTKSYKDNKGAYVPFKEEEDYFTEIGYDDETSSTNSNILVLKVRGNDKNKVRICFRMSMDGEGRKIITTNMQLILESGDSYKHQYDTTTYEKGSVLLSSGIKAKNINVSIVPCDDKGQKIKYTKDVGPWIPPHTITNVDKDFNMPYGPVSKPGTYYCLMKATSSNKNIKASLSKTITVKKVQDERATINWGDDSLYKNIWKGCKHHFRIGISLESELGTESLNKDKLIGTPVNITFIHKGGKRVPYTSTIKKDTKNNDYYVEATISYRGYYDEQSYLEVEIDAKYGFKRVVDQKLITHPWFIADSFIDVLKQLYLADVQGRYVDENGNLIGDGNDVTKAVPNEMGTDWIFLENKTYDVIKTLHINRDITIASVGGSSQSILEGKGLNIVKTVPYERGQNNLMKVNLVGLTFTHAQCAVYSSAGTRLLVERCYFTNNANDSQHHKGCSIYLPDDDYSTKHNELWKTEIRNSYFKNNKGNEIQSVGTTRITANLFVTTSSEYLQQPEVKVVSVRSGAVEYTSNKSYINTGQTPMPSNHSFAKALTYVERGATFNGAGPNQLGGDMTLPVFRNYNNQAYTYAIYYYPYSGIRTEIVCSPRRGHERHATGHGSSFKRWIYYDGYDFVRWNRGRNVGNTYNPWTDEELKIPNNLGIYNKVNEKFIDDYDPRFSKCKSMTSSFD